MTLFRGFDTPKHPFLVFFDDFYATQWEIAMRHRGRDVVKWYALCNQVTVATSQRHHHRDVVVAMLLRRRHRDVPQIEVVV